MLRLRRSNPDLRMDITPMIDVVFLLLTFFIFAFVVMVRARTLDVTLPETGRAIAVGERQTITVSLSADRRVAVEGDVLGGETARGSIEERASEIAGALRTAMDRNPDARVLVAPDRATPSGDLLELIDALVDAGVTEFSVLGRAPAGDPGGPGGEGP